MLSEKVCRAIGKVWNIPEDITVDWKLEKLAGKSIRECCEQTLTLLAEYLEKK